MRQAIVRFGQVIAVWLGAACAAPSVEAPSQSTSAGGSGGSGGTVEIPVGGSPSGGSPAAGGGGGLAGGAGSTVAESGAGGDAGQAGSAGSGGSPSPYPDPTAVLDVLTRVNAQFAAKWPDPGTPIVTNTTRPSNIWTRAVYYEGLLALHAVEPKPEYHDYAVRWGEAHAWQLRNGDSSTTNADSQCAGQVYVDLYLLDGAAQPQRIEAIQQSIDGMVDAGITDAWTWIDAIQMSMPVLARFGVLHQDASYFDAMHALYAHTKLAEADGLYSEMDGLWWRDEPWKAQVTPGAKQVYWSRGNGWVLAALVRVLDLLPASDPHRAEYERDFKTMAAALRTVQRPDGFWNPSLHDAEHFGGPETTGTSLFVYGMAWGIRQGLLPEGEYGPTVVRAWNALIDVAVRDDGFLGFVQSTGDDPSDGQPLSPDKQPDFEDYGVGCFLLAGSELVRLAAR